MCKCTLNAIKQECIFFKLFGVLFLPPYSTPQFDCGFPIHEKILAMLKRNKTKTFGEIIKTELAADPRVQKVHACQYIFASYLSGLQCQTSASYASLRKFPQMVKNLHLWIPQNKTCFADFDLLKSKMVKVHRNLRCLTYIFHPQIHSKKIYSIYAACEHPDSYPRHG